MLQANRFKDQTRGKKRALASKIQRLILSSVNSVEDIPDLLHYVFSPSFNYGLHHKAKDYAEKSAIISNISSALKQIRLKEHQSGTFRAVIAAACGKNIKKGRVAHHLKISRNSVTRVTNVLLFN